MLPLTMAVSHFSFSQNSLLLHMKLLMTFLLQHVWLLNQFHLVARLIQSSIIHNSAIDSIVQSVQATSLLRGLILNKKMYPTIICFDSKCLALLICSTLDCVHHSAFVSVLAQLYFIVPTVGNSIRT